MVSFFETESTLTLSEISSLEEKLGFLLPQNYKDHLLKYNGGRCSPNRFSFVENMNETDSTVDWFLAIYDGEFDNLEDYITLYKTEDKRIPNKMVPIAHDPGGNLLLVSCEENSFGSIYFWDHENEIDYKNVSDNERSNIHFVANSIGEFLSKLK